jgi:uncharacterized membrane protein YkgB
VAQSEDISDAALFSEIQVILSEKRTSLSILRTGIAVFALPLSVLSVLVATSKYYDVSESAAFLFPLLALSVGLMVLADYLIIQAMLHIRRYDRLLARIRNKHSSFAEMLE